ncbi:sensor histidine kinase [Variovorax guangxiensis]|uniref:histidine kinase n=1 Tax=Variovorax guangxiensis TaxID=1775474 RepID=A0A502DIV8_9BURK|nr:HAMP domain-containing sensor histidine kinase [Variovorax guangxiensis]TPG21397.1 sensor histidine kinase [Variovorax ginsengisoli]TPG25447.1 sensor histidine kinase [Variovorax guangxiensis]
MSLARADGAISLADFITGNLEPILQDWEDFAHSLVPLAGLDRATLRDHAEAMLVAIVDNMRAFQSEAERSEKGKGNGDSDALTEAAENHAIARLTDNFSLNQLMAEFRAIRASVLRQWACVLPQAKAGVEEVMRFNEAVDQAITASIARYSNKLDESRAVILGVLAHDLRNPLNAISLGMQYILSADAADAPTMKAAVRAQLSVQRMDGLVRDLLDFTSVRLGTGLPVRPEVVDMAVLCLRTIDEVEAAHPERKILFTTAGELVGECDAGRLSQMLVNLVTNALHHGIADGEVRVTLNGEQQDFVTLEVQNFGPVIPDSVRAGMFQPLNRAMADRRGVPAGSSGLGLGLYIAHEIAIAHQGSLEVVSTEEAGTAFTARLPRHPSTLPMTAER